jgi:putative FmdB family regulatory protein
MPIYEYRCDACQNCFEALRFASDEAPTCPACGSDKVQRQLSCFATAGGEGKSSDLGLASAPSGGGCGSGGFS